MQGVLKRMGMAAKPPHDPRCVAAELLLETTASLYFVDIVNDRVARFHAPRVGKATLCGGVDFSSLDASVDLVERRLLHARFGEQDLKPSDAVNMIWSAVSLVMH